VRQIAHEDLKAAVRRNLVPAGVIEASVTGATQGIGALFRNARQL